MTDKTYTWTVKLDTGDHLTLNNVTAVDAVAGHSIFTFACAGGSKAIVNVRNMVAAWSEPTERDSDG